MSDKSGWQTRAGVIALGIFLTIVMTYPTVTALMTAGRLGTSDGRYSIWNVGWVAHALTTNPLGLFDANIFYPASGTLAYSEPNVIGGALGVPTYLATGSPIAALNGAIALGTLLSFFFMWALVRRLTGSSVAGVLAAVTFTFSPFVSARTAHIQLYLVFVFPMVVHAFVRMVDGPSVLRGAWLGVTMAIAALTCGYYGLLLIALMGLLAAWWATWDLAYWRSLAVGAVVTAALVLPVVVPYMAIRAEAGAGGRGGVESRTYAASWRDYLTSGTDAHAVFSRRVAAGRPADRSVEVLFPGVVVLVVGVAGFVAAVRRGGRQRRWALSTAAVAGLGLWASFGPDAGLYTLIAQLPGMELLRAPARFGILVPFGLSIAGGYAVAQWTRHRTWVGVALVLLAAAELKSTWPLDQMPPLPAAYRLLAQLPPGPVIEYPFPYRRTDFHNHTKAMLHSAYHWRPIVNGYSDFTPDGFEEMAGPVNAFPDPSSFQLLRSLGVRYVVWRASEYNGEARAILEARFAPYGEHLRPLTRDGDVWLYEIVSWPEGAQP